MGRMETQRAATLSPPCNPCPRLRLGPARCGYYRARVAVTMLKTMRRPRCAWTCDDQSIGLGVPACRCRMVTAAARGPLTVLMTDAGDRRVRLRRRPPARDRAVGW